MTRYIALTGGIGGAKLALGLTHTLTPTELMLVANTGDDFEHFGLHISPDIDTLTYTLAALNNPEVGWGRHDETWNFMAALTELGGETWFNLGDRDLALHHLRTQMLGSGLALSDITGAICQQLGIQYPVVPMSDQPVRTMVATKDGELSFQHYFVRERCKPRVSGFRFAGIEEASPAPEFLAALAEAHGVIICPSNPFVSIDPILNLAGVRDALKASPAKVIAVSPIVGGNAIKGPTAKIMRELNLASMADEVADHYGDILDGYVLDELDKFLDGRLNIPTHVTQTVMQTLDDRIDLAKHCVDFIDQLH
ncbi:MAG: 2-phospho-L-lactate transferase [Pseudomonadales bacterium]